MAAEGALLVSSNLGSCAIDPTFTAQVEQRVVKEVCTCCFDILRQYTSHIRWILIKIPLDCIESSALYVFGNNMTVLISNADFIYHRTRSFHNIHIV